MRGTRWFIILSFLLIASSALIYIGHFLIFRDVHHIFIYMVGDVAFVPLEVLLVTIIIHKLLQRREKRERLEKVNMVIGVFFTEIGSELLRRMVDLHSRGEEEMDNLFSTIEGWEDEGYVQALASLKRIKPSIRCEPKDLENLNSFLSEKKEALVRLLENPNLLEHENFTELLWALTHVVEEFGARQDLFGLSASDMSHLNVDINRAYAILIREWVLYMGHLKRRYPYLFSFAMRTNPFDDSATVEMS